ncbi:MAG: RidA family protein [Saccharofermentanales bacterium]
MAKIITDTPRAPKAIGPYSQAVRNGDLLFVSGQIPLDPVSGQMVAGGIVEQMKQVVSNLRAVLEDSGYTTGDIMKTTIFLYDIRDFDIVNKIYAEMFAGQYPARSCVGGLHLPKGALVEIEAIAAK